MYTNATTNKFKLPYWAKGERSSGQSNLRAAQITDNQMSGVSSFLGANGVIREGTYQGTFTSGNSNLTLSTNGSIPALEAVVNYFYVNQNTTLLWSGFPNNSTIYCYGQAVETNIYTTGQVSTAQDMVVSPVWNTTGVTPNASILLAVVTTTGVTLTVNSSSTAADAGTFSTGKPIFVPYSTHRSQIPIDHPALSVTDSKLANEAVLSRTIAPWDLISSGTDVTNGKGVATGHIKNKAVTIPKVDFSSTDTLNLGGAINAAGLINSASGVNATTGYSGKVAFYRQGMGSVPSAGTGSDLILLPGFVNTAVITELLVGLNSASKGRMVFEVRNARSGGGSSISGILQNSDQYGSGTGTLTVGPGTEIAFRITTMPLNTSGLNVYLTGYQTIP